MFGKFLKPFHFVEEVIHPFHNASLAIVAITSIASAITSFFEPVVSVFFSALLTFPLTVGLTFFFLILLNMNWNKVTLIHIIRGPLLLVFFFLSLNWLANKLCLPCHAARYAREHAVRDSFLLMADNFLYREDSGKKNCFGKIMGIEKKKEKEPENVVPANEETSENKGINFDNVISKTDTTAKSTTNLGDNKIIQFFAGPTALLATSLKEFYELYGQGRFLSAIVLALFFAVYIRYLTAKAKKKIHNENSLTGD